MNMPKVLIVDDDMSMHRKWAADLSNRVIILQATTLDGAEAVFEANPDVQAVAMDACLHSSKPNTHGLTMKIRQRFSGPMIAISSSQNYRIEFLGLGCDHSCAKDRLPEKLAEVLGIN